MRRRASVYTSPQRNLAPAFAVMSNVFNRSCVEKTQLIDRGGENPHLTTLRALTLAFYAQNHPQPPGHLSSHCVRGSKLLLASQARARPDEGRTIDSLRPIASSNR